MSVNGWNTHQTTLNFKQSKIWREKNTFRVQVFTVKHIFSVTT